MIKNNILRYMLFLTVIVSTPAYAELDKLELYEGYKFAIGAGTAVLKFDTKIKVTDNKE